MDNLDSHKGPAARKAVRAAGARLLFLPLYSPDLNPIAQVFAKLKLLLRKRRRTIRRSHRTLLDAFPRMNAPPTCETQDALQFR